VRVRALDRTPTHAERRLRRILAACHTHTVADALHVHHHAYEFHLCHREVEHLNRFEHNHGA